MNNKNLEKTVDALKNKGFYALAEELASLRKANSEENKNDFTSYLEGLAYMLDEDLRDLQNIGPEQEAYMPRLEEIIALRNLILIALPGQDFSSIDYIDAVYRFHTHDNKGAKEILDRIISDNPANHWNALLDEVNRREDYAASTFYDIDVKNKDAVTSKMIQLIGQPEELVSFLNFVKNNSTGDITQYALQVVVGLAEQQGYDEKNFRIMLVYTNVVHRIEPSAHTFLMRAISYFFLNNFYQAKAEIVQAKEADNSVISREDYKFVSEKLKQLGI